MNRITALLSLFFAIACGSNGSDDSTQTDGGKDSTSDVAQNDVVTTKDSGNDGSQGCGTCPTGYACGTANGVAVCRSKTTQIPLFDHVFVIMMENTSLSTLTTAINANKAPNLKSWQSQYATASDYHGAAHPSLPNYIALTSGDTQGIGCDCGAAPGNGSCIAVLDVCLTCSCDNGAAHIGDQIETAGKTWMDFGEDMVTPCNMTDSGNYAQRHNPFLYYDNVQTPSSRCTSHVVDFSNFNPSSAASFNFIAPNLIDDMHNPDPTNSTNIPNGDTWLGSHVPVILASSGYKQGGLLVVVWDEDDASGGIGGTTDDPIGLWLFSPYAKSGGYVSPTKANHYSLLATFEDGLGLPRLAKAGQAQPLTDFFPAQ